MKYLTIIFFLILSAPAKADVAECQDAVSRYNSAINDISYALKKYTTCLSNSQGHDDCSFEFRKLKSAQDDLEIAVSGYQMDCQ